jgi:magnesium chelatase subunit D
MNAIAEQQDSLEWAQPALAAALFAVDPAGLQGIVLRSQPGPVRDQWLEQLHELLPQGAPWRKMPLHIGDDRLLGGIDLTATLRSSRPVAERGLLAESDGGVLLIAMAERLESGIAARLAAVLDTGVVAVERSGLSQRLSTRFGVIALDEGLDEDEATPEALKDRLAIHLNLETLRIQQIGAPYTHRREIEAARARLPSIKISNELVEVLCKAALVFGIESLRVALLAVRVARAAAALNSSATVSEEDVALAAQMVFGCRATRLPEMEQQAPAEDESDNQDENENKTENENQPEPETEQSPPESDNSNQEDSLDEESSDPQSLGERVLEATQSAIPAQLMQELRYPTPGRSAARSSAKSAARQRVARRGRRVGTRPGEPSHGSALNLVETLRVAAPWQGVRRAERILPEGSESPVVILRRDDFRINRYQQRSATTTVFAVDASGSAALHRLAEAKGAVELLLAESYQRRDQVALVTFRGSDAELLLPPTRSLVRAKRSLAGLPGGGGTPLAAGIRLALETALSIRRKAETPVIILLTDGRANVTLEGKADRQLAEAEAFDAARAVRAEEITALLVDTSPRPRPIAKQLAETMGAYYLALPHANAEKLSEAARAVLQGHNKQAVQA